MPSSDYDVQFCNFINFLMHHKFINNIDFFNDKWYVSCAYYSMIFIIVIDKFNITFFEAPKNNIDMTNEELMTYINNFKQSIMESVQNIDDRHLNSLIMTREIDGCKFKTFSTLAYEQKSNMFEYPIEWINDIIMMLNVKQ